MNRMKKVLSVLISVCMLLQIASVGVFAASDVYEVVLRNTDCTKFAFYNNVERRIEDPDVLFSLMYNSSHYDDIGVDRPDPGIVFENLATGEIITETSTESPLICTQIGGYWEESGEFFPGTFDLEFDVSDLESGEYKVTVNLTVPQGKLDAEVKPIKILIGRLNVINPNSGNSGGASGGGSFDSLDRTVVDEKYYDSAKVMFDLGFYDEVYDHAKENITRGDFAIALVKVMGAVEAAENLMDDTYYRDLESGTYLKGCAAYLREMGVLSPISGGTFGAETEMTYIQVIKALVDTLGYSEIAQSNGGYPSGYLRVAASKNISKGVAMSNDSTVTGEVFCQLLYNTLFSKQLKVKGWNSDGTKIYEESDESLFLKQGYQKYVGEVYFENGYVYVDGKAYTLNYPKGTEENKTTELKNYDDEILDYPDNGMTLFVKDNEILSGLKYYSANFTVNEGETVTENESVTIAINEIGYTYYRIDGSDALVIPESKTLDYRLSGECGEKTVKIEFLNSDKTVSKIVEKTITLKKQHRLQYHVDGAVFETVYLPCGVKIPALDKTPEKEGYKFSYWDGMDYEVMPHKNFYVKAIFERLPEEPEVTVIEVTLPNHEAELNADTVIEDVAQYVDEDNAFNLCYASTIYEEYIEEPAVFTFKKGDEVVISYSLGTTPLKSENGEYNLVIPVKDMLTPGTYTLTIDLPLAEGKETRNVKPFRFIIEEFTVLGDEPDEPEEPEETVFEATLPNQEAEIGAEVTIKNIETLVDEDHEFALCYASTMYGKYIKEPAVFTFTNGDDVVTYEISSKPLKHENGEYKLVIPVKEELAPGTYSLTIDLPLAEGKETVGVSPFRFTIEEFTVLGEDLEDPENPVEPDEPEDSEEELNTKFTVADTTTLELISGAQIFVTSEDGATKVSGTTDENGVAEFSLENGAYSVQIIADGYEMRNFVITKTEENREFAPYLNKNSLLDIKTSVKEMTKQEMIDAGIDVNAVENKHIYKCVTVLKFVPVTGGDITIDPVEIEFDYIYDAQGTIIQAKPAHVNGAVIYPVSKDVYLIIHSEVTWLKEMFDVQLVVANTSAIENIEDCVANLNLPEGLSLAVMTEGEQSLTANIGTIAPLATGDVHWYVAGDKEGEYLIGGNLTANRVGGGITEAIKASFVMQEPITVLAGNAMKLLIEAEKYATAGQPYKVRYTLQNVSSKTLYDVMLDVIGGKFRKAYSVEELIHNGDLVNLEGLTGEFNNGVELKAEEFKPGDVLSGVFEIKFGEGIDLEHINYMVSQMFTFTGEGSTTEIPTEIRLVDVVREHVLDDGTVVKAASCTKDGEMIFRCADCDYTETRVIPKTEHELGDWVVRKESTCTEKGEKYKKCENCKYEITAELLEGSHVWNNGTVTTAPTLETEGLRTYRCKKCDAAKTEIIPKLEMQEIYFITGDTMTRTYNGYGEAIYNKADNDSENGGQITYTSSNTDVASVDKNGKVTIFKAGTTTITATAAATDIYVESSASYTLTINKAPLKITATDISIFYGETPRGNSYSVSGFVGNEKGSSVLKGAVSYSFDYEAFDPVGEYKSSISGLWADNYEITFVDGKLTVNKAVDYEIELENLTQRQGDVKAVTAKITPADASAQFLVEYEDANGEWSQTLPETRGEYKVRASLVSCDNIEADSEKYFEAVLTIKAGALISGNDGSSIGIEIVENGEEIEYVIPDEVVDDVIAAIPESGEVVIDSSTTDNDVTKLVLPANIIKAIGESDDAENLTIVADASEITMDKDVIENIASKMELDEKVRINIEVVDTSELSESQQAAVNAIAVNATVLQLNMDIISQDAEGNIISTEAVHELGGEVDVRAAFSLPENMTGKKLVVCYVSDNGTTTYMRAEYADGFVSFKTDHFSHYVLAITDCEHTWNEGEVILEATYTSTGIRVYTCTECGETKEEIIPKKTTSAPSGGGGGGGSIGATYTVKFETNGAAAIESVKLSKNDKLAEPAAPVKDGYTFIGWFVDEACTQKYDFAQAVTASFTLYAGWAEGELAFTDVEKDDWFYEAVKFVSENAVMNGVSADKFDPDGKVTRGMFVTMLYRMEGEPEVINKSIPFKDVKADSYYTNAVIWAKQNGFVNGVTENEFAPDKAVSREQLATIVYRYATMKGIDTKASALALYSDGREISDYAADAVNWATDAGVMKGNADGSFRPKSDLTRAEGATVFMRIMGILK